MQMEKNNTQEQPVQQRQPDPHHNGNINSDGVSVRLCLHIVQLIDERQPSSDLGLSFGDEKALENFDFDSFLEVAEAKEYDPLYKV